jgi:hypothetical protein
MKTLFLLYATDTWHTHQSKNLIAVCSSKEQAINMAQMHAKSEDEEISQDDLFNLEKLDQTQNYQGEGEFLIEYATINTFIL